MSKGIGMGVIGQQSTTPKPHTKDARTPMKTTTTEHKTKPAGQKMRGG